MLQPLLNHYNFPLNHYNFPLNLLKSNSKSLGQIFNIIENNLKLNFGVFKI